MSSLLLPSAADSHTLSGNTHTAERPQWDILHGSAMHAGAAAAVMHVPYALADQQRIPHLADQQ